MPGIQRRSSLNRDMEILAIIPARGGSKSIPYKNLALLADKPLIQYSIQTAKQSNLISRVIVSTDSDRIRKLCLELGAEAPFLRPGELALDETTDLPVFQHALEWLSRNENYHPEIVVHLRPTTPLRRKEKVDDAIEILIDNPDADSVRSVSSPFQNPFKMWKKTQTYLESLVDIGMHEPYNQSRQKLPLVYWQNGYVDVTRPETIIEKDSMTGDKILPYIMEEKFIVDIDHTISLKMAEMLLEHDEY